jgi:hypothetical protein
MRVLERKTLSRAHAIAWVKAFEEGAAGFGSIYLPPGAVVTETEARLNKAFPGHVLPAELAQEATASVTGAAVFAALGGGFALLPPFPIKECKEETYADVASLVALLETDWVVALALVHLGRFALGVFEGEKLLSSKVGTGLVHSRHRQGGSSSHRFQHRREHQMEGFFTRVDLHAREQFEPYLKRIDYLIYDGARETLRILREQADWLKKLEGRVLEKKLGVREPKQPALEAAIHTAWESELLSWREA